MNTVLRRLWIPAFLFISFVGLALTGDHLVGFSQEALDQTRTFIRYFVEVGIWISSAFLFVRLVNVFVWDGFVSNALQKPVPRLIKDVFGLIIFLLAISGIIGIVFEKSVTGLWATSGVVGIVLGLALQSMILDVFTGLAINIDAPFRIGDWILLHDRTKEGHDVGRILEINWRTTRILTEANNVVVVPNRMLGDIVITNYHSPSFESRFESKFVLDFEVPVERARRVLLASVKSAMEDQGFVPHQEPHVLVQGSGNLGVEYVVRYWITPWNGTSPTLAADRIGTAILEQIERAGITLAYPKQDVYIDRMPERHIQSESVSDRKRLLRRIELFDALTDEEIGQLAGGLERRFFRAGQNLLVRGEAGESMFTLQEGLLEVYLGVGETGSEEKVAQITAGSFFGEMSLLTGEPRSATVRAVTDVVVYEITKSVMAAILTSRSDLAEFIGEIVARRQLRNVEALADRSVEEVEEETLSLAKQISARMLKFFRGASRA